MFEFHYVDLEFLILGGSWIEESELVVVVVVVVGVDIECVWV